MAANIRHFLRPLLAQIGRGDDEEQRFPSAYFCTRISRASMVFPSPTLSARIVRFERGDLQAKSAASS
jgi:hypothetical protein